MKIGMVTTWHVKCGIATYSEALSKALSDNAEVYIIRIPRFGEKYAEVFNKIAERLPGGLDLIHVQHEYGLYNGLEEGFYNVLREHKIPIVTTMHATGNWQVDRIIAEKSNAVIVHNEHCAKLYQGKCVIIPHGIKPSECAPVEEAKKAYGIDVKAPIVGYLGFISPYKGLETLINVMEKIPEAGLLIAGGWHTRSDTEYGARIKEDSLKRLESRCQWIGYVPEDRLPYAYGAMDVLCYPSNYISESGAMLTGIGFGKAVVARALPPVKEKEKDHALISFEDETDLERKLHSLLGFPDVRKELEKGAKTYAQANSWEKVSLKLISFYQHILGMI